MNLYARLAAHFPRNQSAPCLILPDERVWSYADIEHASARLANALLATGVMVGDRIAVQVDKSPEAFVLYLACLRAGLVFLPLNPAYQRQELAYFLSDAQAARLICRPECAGEALTLLPPDRVYTLSDNAQGSLIDVALSQPDTFENHPSQPSDLAAILYTSGTTGRSKGAMLTHENLWTNADTLAEVWHFTSSDVLLHMLPIFHIHGLFVACHCVLRAGAAMFFEPRFDVERALLRLPDSSVMMGVPTFYTRLLSTANFEAKHCANVRLFISGSAPLLADTFAAFQQRTGHTILERYGMSEGGMFTTNPYVGERRAGSVGMALPKVTVRVVDDAGLVCATGEIGHIQVKGANVFAGYWQQPEKTAAEFTADGFFKTGDTGSLDRDGYLTISGRARDMIISGGLNIYPKEIEDVIDAIPGVVESAVIGVPHADFGEAGTAVVVCEAGCLLDESFIKQSVRQTLAAFKVPKHVRFVEALPRNAMGKVQKNKLREMSLTPPL